uniref:Uncharacterized protein n=1 Tax=Rhizophora mucronata TaxID=61149 RepID=A0A2P2NCB2_RHIMU
MPPLETEICLFRVKYFR